MKWQLPTLVLTMPVLVFACNGSGPMTPASSTQLDGSRVGSPIDIDGVWEWSRHEILTVPDEFAFVFGIEPEGKVTHFRCDVSGLMELQQSGSTVTGVEIETASSCVTRGGQEFPQPGLGVLIPISEGRVRGKSVHLLIGDALIPCPIHAVVRDMTGNQALTMEGTGRCFVPGHPKSTAPPNTPLDLDPPPAGTEKIVSWSATRQAAGP